MKIASQDKPTVNGRTISAKERNAKKATGNLEDVA